ncbi:restriction endonuclease subunit S [Mesoflavibacter zeaxanthinifaciens]|uniref:restriction endonuclease subunit S n=1 Tax=Mesoflavibacter zeaxanthinifaciens TaxID=393060 RepID=UPI003A8D3205
MNNWQKVKLIDVADVKLSSIDKKTKAGQRKVRLCNYTDVYNNSYINNDLVDDFMIASCSESDFERFVLKKGQVAITKDSETTDDIGVPTYIAEDFENVVLGYHLSLITPNEDKLDGKYLNYWLKTNYAKRYFENNATGSGQRCTLVLDVIKSIPIYLPSLSVQKQIAKVLFDLETKIELNNKINTKLESIAKVIYDYWFVQFDFPDASGNPYKSSGGKMIYNEVLKREIPEGWKVLSLESICDIINGYAFKSEWYKASGIKIIRTKNFENGYLNLSDINYLEKEFASEFEKYNLNTFEFLMVMVGASTGKYSIVNSNVLPALQNQNMWRFVSKTSSQLYLNHKLRRIILELESTTNGSARGFFQKGTFLNKKVEIPENGLVKLFIEKVESIYRKIDNNLNENQKLAELRDWLLPMLMNGQVTVKEAKEHLNQAAEPQESYQK